MKKNEVVSIITKWKGLYYEEKTPKNKIILHHTAGYDLYSAEQWLRISSSKAWREGKYYIGVHYWIGRDGTILQSIPEENWAWNTGTGIDRLDKACIAIEIDNLGYAIKNGNYLKDIYNNSFLIKNDEIDKATVELRRDKKSTFFTFKKLEKAWRNYMWYEEYSEEAINALINLVADILKRHPTIERKIYPFEFFFPEDVTTYERSRFLSFSGIITHCQLLGKNQKWDLSPVFPYERFVKELNLQIVYPSK